MRVPVYMSDDFKLTSRVSPYLDKSLLYLLDLSSTIMAGPPGLKAPAVGTSVSRVGKVLVSLKVLLLRFRL